MGVPLLLLSSFFFFNDTATTEIYPLSLHDALPISCAFVAGAAFRSCCAASRDSCWAESREAARSEEHTSELQSHLNLVCRLLLEKKKNATPKLPAAGTS